MKIGYYLYRCGPIQSTEALLCDSKKSPTELIWVSGLPKCSDEILGHHLTTTLRGLHRTSRHDWKLSQLIQVLERATNIAKTKKSP